MADIDLADPDLAEGAALFKYDFKSKGFGDSNIFAPEAMRRMLKAAIPQLQRVSS